MSDISTKLTYLNTTKGLIKDVINMTGAGIDNNTTFRNYAQALYDGYINVLKDRDTLLDNMPKSTSTGSISEGLGLPIYEDKMSKLSSQDGTPTPSNPVEVNTVKGYRNLLKNTSTNDGDGNYWYVYSTFDEETRTLTRSTTATTESYITHYLNNMKSNTTYTLCLYAKSNGYVKNMDLLCFNGYTQGVKSKSTIYLTTEYQKVIWTFTTASDVDYSLARIRIDNNGSTESGTEAILTIKDVMLVEGEYEDINYVPYGNNYVDVKVIGKNLFNKDTATTGKYINKNNGNYNNGNSSDACSDYINVYGLSKIILSGNEVNYSNGGAFYDNEKTYISGFGSTTLKNGLDVPNNAYYVRVSLLSADLNTTQLEKGSTATTYEAYKETIATIPLNNNEIVGIGDYKDELIVDKNGHCWLNKKTLKYILDENATINVLDSGTVNYRYSIPLSSSLNIVESLSSVPNKSTHYARTSISSGNTNNGFKNYGTQILIRYGEEQSIDDYKMWLENNNVEFIFAISTPVLIDLNYTVDMTLYEGTNTITNSEDMDMSIKYIKDTYE